ncbi:MAG TPA: hypothetical protein VF288_10685 [Mycobacteriales bacterium]
MSRCEEFDEFDEPFPNARAMYAANADRALRGKRGRAMLADLREALLALPDRRLVSGALSTASLRRWVDAGGDGAAERWPHAWEDDRSAADALVEREGIGVCAVGAYCWWKAVEGGADPREAMAELPVTADLLGENEEDTALAGEAAGMSRIVAREIVWLNDGSFGGCTPEERYERVLRWIGGRIGPRATEPTSAASTGRRGA